MKRMKFSHRRLPTDTCSLLRAGKMRLKDTKTPMVMTREQIREEGLEIAPHGGLTTVVLLDGDQEIARGEAWCSPFDCFRYDLGREISMGRALDSLNPDTAIAFIDALRSEAAEAVPGQ